MFTSRHYFFFLLTLFPLYLPYVLSGLEMATQFFIDLGISDNETYTVQNKTLKFDSAKDIQPYLKEMDAVENLRKVDFSGNTIGIEASKELASSLVKHKATLEEVNFADFFTGRLKDEIPQSLDYLLPAVLECPKVTVLNLSDNAIGLQAIDPLESFLAKAVSLEHLILSNNGMGPFAGERIGKALYRLAKAKARDGECPASLKTFYCGRNRLENGSVNYLGIGLKAHAGLECVRLYQNGIRPAGIAKLLTQALKHNSRLVCIDLQDNTLTQKGSDALAESIPSWKLLKEINVNDCLLKSMGSLSLVSAFNSIGFESQLETVKLQYNELDHRSLTLLPKIILEKLPNLKALELNGNRFDEDSEVIEEIKEIFQSRGFGEVDELDDLEEPDSEEEEEEDEEDEDREEDGADLAILEKDLACEEEELVAEERSESVEKLARALETVL